MGRISGPFASAAPGERVALHLRTAYRLFQDPASIGAMKISAGVGAGQLATMLAGPILTRLYSVDDFGKFASVWAAGSVISSIACLRLEVAVLLPNTNE